jgi:hypothetical protein
MNLNDYTNLINKITIAVKVLKFYLHKLYVLRPLRGIGSRIYCKLFVLNKNITADVVYSEFFAWRSYEAFGVCVKS